MSDSPPLGYRLRAFFAPFLLAAFLLLFVLVIAMIFLSVRARWEATAPDHEIRSEQILSP